MKTFVQKLTAGIVSFKKTAGVYVAAAAVMLGAHQFAQIENTHAVLAPAHSVAMLTDHAVTTFGTVINDGSQMVFEVLSPSAHATLTYDETVTSLAVDPSIIYTAVKDPFTTALTFTIGAIAVLAIIRWIRRGMSK